MSNVASPQTDSAGALAAVGTKLDAIAANQVTPPAPVIKRKTGIDNTLTAQFEAATLTRGMNIFNESTTIDLRVSQTSGGTTHYATIPPRTWGPFMSAGNTDDVFLGSASGTVDASCSGS